MKRANFLYNVLMVEIPGWLANLSRFVPVLLYFVGLYLLFVWGACALAYIRNQRLPADDSDRRDFHIAALVLAPFTLPFIGTIWLGYIFLRTILFSMMFGCFLILFPVCLIVLRSVNLLRRLFDAYQRIGETLLRANMFLLRLTGLFPSRA